MTRIEIDDRFTTKLSNLAQPTELCDSQGNVLGKFFPTLDQKTHDLEPQISDEEIARRKQDKGKTYTTAEVIKHLESL